MLKDLLLAMCHVILSASGQGSVGRRHTALQGQVAAADQTAHLAVADPNRQASQPHPSPRAVRLDALGDRRLETRYIWWVIFWQRVSADHYGVPLSKSSGPQPASAKKRAVDRRDPKCLMAAEDFLWSHPSAFKRDSRSGPASIAVSDLVGDAQRREGGRVVT